MATPLTYLNVILLLALFASGGYAVLSLESFPTQALTAVSALLTADTTVYVQPALAAHMVVACVFLAYLPFTQMMHFVAKYFTYHQVRWDDAPLEAGSRTEKEVEKLLAQTVTWGGPHLGADGKKSWVDIATGGIPEEADS
jgi:nitrate reductase gamma subunit